MIIDYHNYHDYHDAYDDVVDCGTKVCCSADIFRVTRITCSSKVHTRVSATMMIRERIIFFARIVIAVQCHKDFMNSGFQLSEF